MISTPNLFINTDAKSLRELNTDIDFGNAFDIFTKCVTITHKYSDDTEIKIYIKSNNSISIFFSYRNRSYYDMKIMMPFNNDCYDDYDDYDNSCTGYCGGCSNMHDCHDLG